MIKKINTYSLLLKLFYCTIFYVCFLAPHFVEAQKTKAILTFKDGTIKKGFGKLTSGDKVKFKANKKAASKKYDFSALKAIKIYDGSDITKYVSLKVEKKKEPNNFRRNYCW